MPDKMLVKLGVERLLPDFDHVIVGLSLLVDGSVHGWNEVNQDHISFRNGPFDFQAAELGVLLSDSLQFSFYPYLIDLDRGSMDGNPFIVFQFDRR